MTLVVLGVTVFVGVPNLLENFGRQVNEGLSLRTLTSALGVVVSPRLNILLNPKFTPPGLTALAVLGAIDLWRRGKRALTCEDEAVPEDVPERLVQAVLKARKRDGND